MRGLYIPSSGFPEILNDDLNKIKSIVFGSDDTTILTFDGYANFYIYNTEKYIYSPINQIATFFRRMYSHNYEISNVIRGPILVCGSLDGIPGIIDSSVPGYFLEQLFRYYNINAHEYK
jgi:hypothetical protein